MEYMDKINHFIERSIEIHGDKYDYSKSVYVDYRTPLTIICPIHGEFEQSPNKHLSKRRGCPKCAVEKRSQTQRLNKSKQFIEKANSIHNNKYLYRDEYIKVKNKLKITCPIHGDFYQTPNDHLQGHGCPKCNQSKLESDIEKLLIENNIEYIPQYSVPNDEKLKIDFFIPNKNIAIECQGEQHFNPIEYFGGNNEFQKIIKRDVRKYSSCVRACVNIIYYINNINIYNNILNNKYKNNNIYNINNIYIDKNKLLKDII